MDETSKNSQVKYVFSVIIYNNNISMLKQSIDSIISQTLKFEDNIELIILENNNENVLEFTGKYDNISSIKVDEILTDNTFNLDKIKGKYVNLINSGDYFTENTFEDVLEFFKKHNSEINLVNIPIKYYDKKESYTLSSKFNENNVVNLKNNPNNPIDRIESLFIKKEYFKRFSLDYLKNLLNINKILLENNTYGIVSNCSCFSKYSTIIEKRSTLSSLLEDFFIELINYCQNKENQMDLFIHYTLSYMIYPIIKVSELNEDKNVFWEKFNYVIKNIDQTTFFDNQYVPHDLNTFYSFLLNDKKYIVEERGNKIRFIVNNQVLDTFDNHPLYLDSIRLDEESLVIEGLIGTLFDNNNVTVNVIDPYTREILSSASQVMFDDANRGNSRYLGIDWLNRYNFSTKIPIETKKVDFRFNINYYDEEQSYNFSPKIAFTSKSLLNRTFNKLTGHNKKLSILDNTFTLKDNSFVFSIVIPVTSSTGNIYSQINSVINQRLFSNFTQVIFVDASSNDSVRKFIIDYKEDYPNNIFYVKSSNQEMDNIISTGINHANGQYISILKPNTAFIGYELEHAKKKFFEDDTLNFVTFDLKKCYDTFDSPDHKNICCNDSFFIKREYLMENIKNKSFSDIIYNISLENDNKSCINLLERLVQKNFVDKTVLKDVEKLLLKLDVNNLSLDDTSKLNNILSRFCDNTRKEDVENCFDDENIRKLLYNLKYNEFSEEHISIKEIKVSGNNLLLKGYLNHTPSNDIKEINVHKETQIESKIIPYHLTGNSPKQCTLLEKLKYVQDEFIFSVPLEKDIETNIHFNIIRNNENKQVNIKYNINDCLNKENEIISPYFISKKEKCITISRGYKFSVVMAIYNTSNYLYQTINSVINQSIGFEDNIQLILIDDGSIDDSNEICKGFVEKYPNNIILLEQENSGQAVARNNGLKYVKGKYVNFMDSDDYFESNAFEEVYSFFKIHDYEIDMVGVPIKFFGRQDEYHMLHDKFEKTRVIDLLLEPNNPQLQAASTFLHNCLFEEYEFPTNVISSEDAILLNKILFRKKRLGVVSNTAYNYRKRFDESSTIDAASKQKEFFTDKLKNYYLELIHYSIEKENTVLAFLQYMLAYDLQWMLKEPDISILNSEEQDEFWKYLKEVVFYIDKRCIRDNKYISYPPFIGFFLSIKNGGNETEFEENNIIVKTGNFYVDSFNYHNIWLDIVEIRDNTLYISGLINSHHDISEISVKAIKECGDETSLYTAEYVKYTSRENLCYLSKTWLYKYSFDVQIPLSKGENSKVFLRTYYHKDGNKNNYAKDNVIFSDLSIEFNKHARLSKISNYFVKDDYILVFENNIFRIENYSYNKMRKYEAIVQDKIYENRLFNYKEAIQLRKKYLRYFPFIRLFKRFFKIYLFMDRIVSGDDNAEHLFRYAVKQKDSIRKYFVVSEDSPDYNRLKKYGNVIAYKSSAHKFMFLLADKIISTHPYDTQINPFFSFEEEYDERENYSGLVNSQVYFLQHGVTKDNISDWMRKYDKNLSLIVTVNDREKESFYEEGYGFDKSIIQTLGFPRYDNLENNPRKQILIIPTWRKYLKDNKNLFMSSDYFNNLNSLLNNEKLINYAKSNDYSIVFKAHPELEQVIDETDQLSDERYIDLFSIDPYVKLSTEESYQELINTSSLLITDYSSVFYDFAYQKKPVIYYHPADDYHYEQGYFDYRSMGFGDIVEDEISLVSRIKEYIDSGCVMNNKYMDRVDSFFKYTDKNNSKRVYQWIKKH